MITGTEGDYVIFVGWNNIASLNFGPFTQVVSIENEPLLELLCSQYSDSLVDTTVFEKSEEGYSRLAQLQIIQPVCVLA